MREKKIIYSNTVPSPLHPPPKKKAQRVWLERAIYVMRKIKEKELRIVVSVSSGINLVSLRVGVFDNRLYQRCFCLPICCSNFQLYFKRMRIRKERGGKKSIEVFYSRKS